jgi:2,5-diketo-D-gluconate reductase A
VRENLDLFRFDLDADDMADVAALDRGEAGRSGPHPDTFAWVPD